MILPLTKNTKEKSSRHRAMLVMVLTISSSLVFMILYKQALNEEFAMGSYRQRPPAPSIPSTAPSNPRTAPSIPRTAPSIPRTAPSIPRTAIGVNERSLGYLPYAGLTNQHAAWTAFHLNRTLILPPITSNKHDHQLTFQGWSHYFDIPRFEKLSGVRVKEWADAKPLSEKEIAIGVDVTRKHKLSPQWDSLAENITCQITRNFSSLQGVDKTFANLFLLRVSFVEPPPRPASVHLDDATENAINTASGLSFLSDIIDRYRDSEEKSLYLSHTYSLKGSHSIRPWEEIGQHIHFKQEVVDLALHLVQSLQSPPSPSQTNTTQNSLSLSLVKATPSPSLRPNNDTKNTNTTEVTTRPSPSQKALPSQLAQPSQPTVTRPYIAVHLRRSDIVSKCVNRTIGITQEAIDACAPSIAHYAVKVDQARTQLKRRTSVEPLVVVTTDTTSQEDLDAIVALGWHRVDHVQAETNQILGLFGAAMVDAAILAHADVLVGTAVSTMSQVAQFRQRSWFQRQTLFPRHDIE
ncbi:hypothetical protein BGZ52_010494 [Haplosporangium bisporale]|nr:hypothetical protein BGZ52_010494 [Haplosporangium bisporale]